MQKSIQSKALSLFLSALLCLTVFAAVEITIPNAYAADFDIGGYEVNFATDGNTSGPENGITATLTVNGNNPTRASIRATLSGTPTADGCMSIEVTGTAENGTFPTKSGEFYVKQGVALSNQSLGFGSINLTSLGNISDLEISSFTFSAEDVYKLTVPAEQTINGQEFTVFFDCIGDYLGENADVVPFIEMDGEPTAAGTYTATVSSVKAGFNQTLTIPTGDDDWFELDSLTMPNKDVDDIVFTVTFASSGGSNNNSSSSSSSSSSSGSSRNTYTPPSAPTPAPITSAKAVESVKAAIDAAKNSPNGATVKLQNVSEISLDTMKQMAKAAGNTALKVNADNLNADGSVDVRISLDPSKATSALNLSASTTSPAAKAINMTFAKYFSNKVSVLSLSQKGSFGMPVTIATKLDKTLKADSLVFYSYDSKTNKFTQIKEPQYKVDKNGFVHFTTSVGGEMIIGDKPLTRK